VGLGSGSGSRNSVDCECLLLLGLGDQGGNGLGQPGRQGDILVQCNSDKDQYVDGGQPYPLINVEIDDQCNEAGTHKLPVDESLQKFYQVPEGEIKYFWLGK